MIFHWNVNDVLKEKGDRLMVKCQNESNCISARRKSHWYGYRSRKHIEISHKSYGYNLIDDSAEIRKLNSLSKNYLSENANIFYIHNHGTLGVGIFVEHLSAGVF